MNYAVLGVGSAHGDDQIGWLLIDYLSQRPLADAIVLEKLSAPGASLVECFQRYDRLLVIDACQIGAAAGEYVLMPDAADYLLSADTQRIGFSSHAFSVVEACQLANQLQLPLPQVSLFLVQIEQTETMASISNTLKVRIPDYINAVEDFVSSRV